MPIRLSRRDIGALLLLGCTVIVFIGAFILTDPLNEATMTIFISVIGFGGAMYVGGSRNPGMKTLYLPKGIVRIVVVGLSLYALLFAPVIGVRPLLIEVIAAAFGRSLRGEESG